MKRFLNIALASIVILFSMTSCIDNLLNGIDHTQNPRRNTTT